VIRTEGEQVVLLRRGPGEPDGRRAGVAHDLDGGEADGRRRGRDGHEVTRPDVGDRDESAVGRQVRHPEGRGLHAREVGRVLAERAGRNDGFLAERAVSALVESGNGGDALADPRAIDSLAHRLDDPCGFVSEPRREVGLYEAWPLNWWPLMKV
jgi:hypothetical protein